MPSSNDRVSGMTRRGFIQTTGAAGVAAAALDIGTVSEASAARANTLVVASPATPQGLDMEFDSSLGFVDCLGAMYDNLLAYEKIPDPKSPDVRRENLALYPDRPGGLALEGRLAESWGVSADGLKATFKLREGVKSNWGNTLSAADVKWTWDRKFAEKVQGAFNTSVLGLTSPDQIKIEGDNVVSFNFEKPTPILFRQQVSPANPIFDSTKLKEVGGTDDPWGTKFLQNDSAGFGPYRLKQIIRGQQAIFTARDDYYGAKPFMKTVIMKEVPNSASRLSLLQGGAIDIAQFLEPREYLSLKNSKTATFDAVDASYMMWLSINCTMKPFDDVRVRQAMNYVIPYKDIIDTVYFGLATHMTAPMPHIYPMADNDFAYDENIDKAKQLLASAGLKDGFTTTLSYNAGDPTHEPIALIYQTALAKIGIKIVLDKLPAGVFYDYVAKRSKPLIFFLDSPWTSDAGYALELYFDSRSFIDYSNYKNAKVNDLIRTALVTLDDVERKTNFTEVQKIVMNEAPWGFISYPQYCVARAQNLKGFTYYTANNLRFQDFYRA